MKLVRGSYASKDDEESSVVILNLPLRRTVGDRSLKRKTLKKDTVGRYYEEEIQNTEYRYLKDKKMSD